MNKTNEVPVVLTLAFGGAVAIAPFAAIRLLQGEWLLGMVDTVMVLGMLALGVFVKLTHKVSFASITLSILALSGLVIVIHLKGPDLLFWAYPTMVGAFFLLAPHLAVLLTMIAILAIVPALVNKIPMTDIAIVMITLIVNSIFAYVFTKQKNQQRDLLSQLVRRDSLTGANNRRALDEKLEELIAINDRTGQIAALIFLDIDHFKNINDTYGHSVGDQVLINLTKLIKKRIRITDCLYRFGGEEFVVLLMNSNLNTSKDIAEQLRHIVEKAGLLEDKVITVSLGVAEYVAKETASSWLARGDKALYQAKDSGRNKTCVAK